VRARDVERQTRSDRKGQTKAKEPITFRTGRFGVDGANARRSSSGLSLPPDAPWGAAQRQRRFNMPRHGEGLL
jgi:hypothetical protein